MFHSKIYLLALLVTLNPFGGNLYSQSWNSVGAGMNKFGMALYADNKDSLLYISIDNDIVWNPNDSGALIWNRSQLINMPGYLMGSVALKITEYNGNIYYASGAGVNVIMLSQWNGKNWHTVPDTNFGPVGPFIGAINEFHGELYIACNCIYGPSINQLFKYNDTIWDVVSSDSGIHFQGFPNSSIVYNDYLFLGGSNMRFDSLNSRNIAYFDGTIFKDLSLPDSVSCAISAFEIHKDTLYCATGCGHIFRLVNNSWEGVLNCNSEISSLKSAEGNLYVGGNFTKMKNVSVNPIGYYKNGNVYGMNGGTNSYVADIEYYQNDIYIIGDFTEVDNKPIRYLARWGEPNSVYTTGEAERSELYVFPNPAKNQLEVMIPEPLVNHESMIEISNSEGKLVYNKKVRNDKNTIIDISEYKQGMYFIKITSTEVETGYSNKFIKE